MTEPRKSILILFSFLLHGSSSFVPTRQQLSTLPLLASSDDSAESSPVVIALTREQGNNDKLRKELIRKLEMENKITKVDIVELPCIAHADGPDFDKLPETLTSQAWDYVAVTSPEAARVLASVWKDVAFASHPPPAVAVVGKATEEALLEAGISVAYCPSKATAKVLVQELPQKSETTTLLYPASAKAAQTLQDGLTERGFAVTRLDTYDTVTASWTPEEALKASQTKIVCVASPSSIQGWLSNTETSHRPSFLVACIGETSAEACRDLGFDEDKIFYPEKPGIPGWVAAIVEALESLTAADHPVAAPN